MDKEHTCWKIEKNRPPNKNHYRFRCIKKVGFLKYIELWNCWNCYKNVTYKIPFLNTLRPDFSNYYKHQKCKAE